LPSGTACNQTATGETALTNGQTGTYDVSCTLIAGKFKGDIIISYINQQTGMEHSKTGELILKV